MRCDEFRKALVDIVHGEGDGSHADTCPECAAALEAARAEEKRLADDLRTVFDVDPDPIRRKEFIDRLAVRKPEARPLRWLAAAAAAVIAGIVTTLTYSPRETAEAPPRVRAYPDVLREEINTRLLRLAGGPVDGELVEPVVIMEAAAIEEEMAQHHPAADVALHEAPHRLLDADVSRRAAARRVLAAVSPAQLQEIRVDEPAAKRYLRVLADRPVKADPKPEGKVVVSIFQMTSAGGKARAVKFEQYANGAVRLQAREGEDKVDVWAHDVYELAEQHPDLCRRFGVSSAEGRVQMGSPLKSRYSISVSVGRARERLAAGSGRHSLDELEGLRTEALAVQVARSRGDVEQVSRLIEEVQRTVEKVDYEGELKGLRSASASTKSVEGLERVYGRVRRLEVFCDTVRALDR